ncbi:RadC family protein [Methylomonas rhizoryzae]|uniref:RadC family protein n=1 Tax=Methylomonas rhizoryzae TaxID=2608981 RepID=UPI001E336900|nr:DNA repair protein RadC [Methylomonas rhizoryzae]
MAAHIHATNPLKLPYFVADAGGKYSARRSLTEAQIIKAAALLLNQRVERGDLMNTPELVGTYFQTRLRERDREVFACLYLSAPLQVIQYEELFKGTVDTAAIYPREVVKRCVQLGASSLFIAHNHPSGDLWPSDADRNITNLLKQALQLIDVRLLDHFIIGNGAPFSFAQRGLI